MGAVSVGIGKDDWWRRWMELTRFSTQDDSVLGFQNPKPGTAFTVTSIVKTPYVTLRETSALSRC